MIFSPPTSLITAPSHNRIFVIPGTCVTFPFLSIAYVFSPIEINIPHTPSGEMVFILLDEFEYYFFCEHNANG